MRLPLKGAIMARAPTVAIAATLTLGAMTPIAAARDDYANGFTWHRMTDYTPGVTHGSTMNNPGPDRVGNPAWQYTWTTGDAWGETSPWYKNPGELMIWNKLLLNEDHGAWSQCDNVSPNIGSFVSFDSMCHGISNESYKIIPVAEWLNPAGHDVVVGLTGSLTLLWTGQFGMGSAVDVDVVIFRNDVARGIAPLLMHKRVSKPTPGDSMGETVVIDVDIQGVRLDLNDSIIFSHRAVNSIDGRWIAMFDDVTITLGVVCRADFNGDCVVNTLDFLLFMNMFNNSDPSADFNEDGQINSLDVLDFLNAFNAGC